MGRREYKVITVGRDTAWRAPRGYEPHAPVPDPSQQEQDLEIQANAGIYGRWLELLERLMAESKSLITTPHVLSELSNLGDLHCMERSVFRSWFVRMVEATREHYEHRSAGSPHAPFPDGRFRARETGQF